jgi:phosphate/sulfate permease
MEEFFFFSFSVFSWIVFSVVVGFVGRDRELGFWKSFLLSIILSPIIGFIFAVLSKNIEDEDYKFKLMQVLKEQQKLLAQISQASQLRTSGSINIATELEKLDKMNKDGRITDEEFQKLKYKIINS